MEDIISTVLDIEKEAQKLLSDAQKAAGNICADADVEIENIRASYNQKMEARISKMQQHENDFFDAESKKIEAYTKSKIDELNEKYKQNKDKWIDMLFGELFGDVK